MNKHKQIETYEEGESESDLNRSVAVIQNSLGYIQSDIKEIKEKLDHNYVSKEEFEPIKKIVYGLVALILIAVVGAIVALVIRK